MNKVDKIDITESSNSKEKKIMKRLCCDVCKTIQMDKKAYISHVLSKNHIHKLHTLAMEKDKGDCSVCVSQYTSDTTAEDIAEMFWVFGIRCLQYSTIHSIVQFECPYIAKVAVKAKYTVNGRDLKVTPKTNMIEDLSISDLLNYIINKPNTQREIDNQITNLISDIEFKDMHHREVIRFSMEGLLLKHFPSANAFIFGSSGNNLGYKGCDLDIYIELDYSSWTIVVKYILEKNTKDLAKAIADLMIEDNIGYEVQAVPHAKVPIVRFRDWSTGIKVDLSFNNRMALIRTELVSLYVGTHVLVRPYLMFIRYWAKIQGIIGGSVRESHITSYALTMILLWYLMYQSPPIIPTVEFLQNSSGNITEYIINGWNFSFSNNIISWKSLKPDVSVLELVYEFFKCFGSLDMKDKVINPYSGNLLDSKSARYMDFKSNRPVLCTLDPFDHADNITNGLSKNALNAFQSKCQISANICKDILKGSLPLSALISKTDNTEETNINIYSDDK